MKIIVTGASGYVGGVILKALRAAGHETHGWSRANSSPPWTYFDLAKDIPENNLQDVVALIHAAHDFSPRSLDENNARNIQPSLRLLQSAKSADIKTLIYISSMSAYEGTASIYGKTKLAIEKDWITNGGIVVRPGLVWGEKPGGVMGAIDSLVNKSPVIPIIWSKNKLAQFLIHENDLAETILNLATTSSTPEHPIIHAHHPEAIPLTTLVKRIISNKKLTRILLPIPYPLALLTLRMLESIGIKAPFRSDSLLSLNGTMPNNPNSKNHIKSYKAFPFENASM